MKQPAVDEFVNTRLLPELRPIVAQIRFLMKEFAPGVQELISYGIPAYRAKRIIAVISPTKKEITFSFSRGVQFEDKYHLLRGLGKSSRHVKLKKLGDVNRTVLRYYIKQALKLDEK